MSKTDTDRYRTMMDTYGAQHYTKQSEIIFQSGKGIYLRDTNGKVYIDAAGGYSSVNLGHNHPKICAIGTELYATDAKGWGVVNVVPNAFATVAQAEFLEYSCTYLGADRAIATNGGAEGIETAIKLMLKYGYTKKGIPRHEAKIIVCDGNFHGRTTTIVGFSSNELYRRNFGPYAGNFISIPYDDTVALADTLRKHRGTIAGFLVEPIQGEGGVRIPEDGYLRSCNALCEASGVIFCADEIQTGLGRTGTLLACTHDRFTPDIFVLGKSLGAGRNAVSVVYAKDKYMCFEPGEHGSTYGGNASAMTLARAVLEIIKKEKLCENSAQQGAYLLKKLRRELFEKWHPLVKDVRGRGLMIGIELRKSGDADRVIKQLLEHGVMTKDAHGVIRITPPLVITRGECGELVRRIVTAFEALGS